MTQTESKSDLKRVAGCWLKQSKRGTPYMSIGPLSETLPKDSRLLMFRNRQKDPEDPDDKRPDYEIFIRDEQLATPQPAAATPDGDIPF